MGYTQGLYRGELRAREKIVHQLIKSGLPLESIAKIIELAAAELRALKLKLNSGI